jgi:GntR family transcriptional repressor for pyruvate dehydrogenase complex
MKHLITERIAETLARNLEDLIVESAYKPGERLPSERELAVRLGVSRATLREAVGKLVERGLLIRRQGAGTYVCEQIDDRMSDPWTEMLRRHPLMQGDLLEFREMLEARMAELAAVRANEQDRSMLTNRFEAVALAYREPNRPAQINADIAFHRAIADATHNPVFSLLNACLTKLLHEHIQISISDLPHDSDASRTLTVQHQALFDAILKQDPVKARRAATAHIGFVKVRLNHGLHEREKAKALRGDEINPATEVPQKIKR